MRVGKNKSNHLLPSRKTRRAVYQGYHYLIWKLGNPDSDLLGSKQAQDTVKGAVKAFCKERDILIQELAVWKESVHLGCSLPPRHTGPTLGEYLKKTTADRLQGVMLGLEESPWAEGYFSQTISFQHLDEAKEMVRSKAL